MTSFSLSAHSETGGVQGGFKNRAVNFQVGPEFKNLPIDGYELSLNPVARMKLIELKISL
jgi:hypothetical protein